MRGPTCFLTLRPSLGPLLLLTAQPPPGGGCCTRSLARSPSITPSVPSCALIQPLPSVAPSKSGQCHHLAEKSAESKPRCCRKYLLFVTQVVAIITLHMFIVLCSFKGFFTGCSVDVPSASGSLRFMRQLEHRRVTCLRSPREPSAESGLGFKSRCLRQAIVRRGAAFADGL